MGIEGDVEAAFLHKLSKVKPLVVFVPANLAGTIVILRYLRYWKGYPISLNYSFCLSSEIIHYIDNRTHPLPDICVLPLGSAAALIRKGSGSLYKPLMLMPNTSQCIVVPETGNEARINTCLLVKDRPSSACCTGCYDGQSLFEGAWKRRRAAQLSVLGRIWTMAYTEQYESPVLRSSEEPRPWDIVREVCRYAKKDDKVLDIGCGTARKLKDIAPSVGHIYALDPNERMLNRARENIDRWGVRNITLVKGYAEALPFSDDEFDVVTCMVSVHDTREVWRVLKPGGYAIIEKIGDRDKWNLKKEFGKDEHGWRGFLSEYAEGERASMYEKEFSSLFERVSVRTGTWKTWYSLEGLALLCKQVSTVRNFDREKDADILRRIEQKFMTNKGIETMQNRILICARK